MSVHPPPWQTVSMPPAGALKRSNPGMATPSPVFACSLRRSIAVAIPLKTAITRAVSRDKKVHGLSPQISNEPAATTHGFQTAAESAPANERAAQDGEESPDSPNRAENGGQGPHPPLGLLSTPTASLRASLRASPGRHLGVVRP